MKISEKLAAGSILLVFLFFAPMRSSAQNGSSSVPVQANPKNIALCFPLRADELSLSQFLSLESDGKLLWRLIGERLAMPQSLANGSPSPEAVSISKLMAESLRAGARIDQIISIDIDALKALRPDVNGATIFQNKTLQNADAVVFIMYIIQDTTVQFGAILLTRAGESAAYFSGTQSVFALSEATKEAVNTFVAKRILAPAAQSSTTSSLSAGQSAALPSSLPSIGPWKDKPKYEQASSRLKFSIGGVSIGLSASMVCLGLWESYQEAAYRNTAFETAVTASGIAMGASLAVTAAFLTSAIWNAVLMLLASH